MSSITTTDNKTFLNELARLVGHSHLLTEPAKTARYRKGFRSGQGDALAVVFPGSLLELWRVLNACVNCVDRHLPERADQTAIIWEPDDPAQPARHITYAELSEKVQRMANVLLSQGVMRGDRVVIYLPMIPEAAYAMLACARIGAIHSIVFAGFSPDALANRINDCGAKLVITADTAPRGGRRTALKSNTDAALLHCSDRVRCLVVKHTGDQTTWVDGRDVDVLALMAEGASNKMIARQLGISVHTVKFHVGSLLDKLDATGRTDAVAHAARRGVIEL